MAKESFEQWIKEELVWLPERGMGRFPVPKGSRPYDQSYFDKYVKMGETQQGKGITLFRRSFVDKYTKGEVCDVGIGSGDFVVARPNTKGFDVNPAAIKWLNKTNFWLNPYESSIHALSFWDSLEHIDSPQDALKQVEEYVFVSVPIFDSCEHLLKSKHFRKDEHIWYWTERGFIEWMSHQNFGLLEMTTLERSLGREDISTFAFRRMS